MSGIGGKVVPKFRDVFRIPDKEVLHWFPGHMGKGLKQMQKQLAMVDCVIEVHDARIPISGRNPNFRHTVTGLKPHIFVLNKKDLADSSYQDAATNYLQQEGFTNIIYTNFKDQKCEGLKKILPLATSLIKDSNRYNRTNKEDYALMVIGVPNVGKSSLINRLRNRYLRKSNATSVGAIAGITRSVLTKIRISNNPSVFLLDTPGVLTPNVPNAEAGLKLGLVSCLQDHLVGPEIMADYLLYWLNKQNKFDYVEKLGIPEPCDNIMEVLLLTATKLGKKKKFKNWDGQILIKPDTHAAAEYFLKTFRIGELGPICLDADLLTNSESQNLVNSTGIP
ncbi:mitochondrial GTPase 1 [Neodiprion lecontei]|uniref:Mitochondrial GTPase 1 n=1 Tax=Neodiprion lecontei TaxID=441921 RepID=A0A6J0BWQ6_NEOLC|nr:mitochondrial GTPase 1 [Neodiprion lecontei]